MINLQEVLKFWETATILQINNELIHVKFKFSSLGLEDEVFFTYSSSDQVIHMKARAVNHPFDLGINKARIEKIRYLFIKSAQN